MFLVKISAAVVAVGAAFGVGFFYGVRYGTRGLHKSTGFTQGFLNRMREIGNENEEKTRELLSQKWNEND